MREPSFEGIKQIQADLQTQYMRGNIASQRLGISPLLLSRITGTIFVKQSSNGLQQDEVTHNIGFNLKFTKKNAEVCIYIFYFFLIKQFLFFFLILDSWLYSESRRRSLVLQSQSSRFNS